MSLFSLETSRQRRRVDSFPSGGDGNGKARRGLPIKKWPAVKYDPCWVSSSVRAVMGRELYRVRRILVGVVVDSCVRVLSLSSRRLPRARRSAELWVGCDAS